MNPEEHITLETRLQRIEFMMQELMTELKKEEIDFLTIQEVSKQTKIPVDSLRRHARAIGFYKPGKKMMFKKSDVYKWFTTSKAKRV